MTKKGIADILAFVVAVFIGGMLWIWSIVIVELVKIFKRKDK